MVVLEVSQDILPLWPGLQEVRPERGHRSLGCRVCQRLLPSAGHQTFPPPERSQLPVDFLPFPLPVRQLSRLTAVLGLLQLFGLFRVPLPFVLLLLSFSLFAPLFPLIFPTVLLGLALRTLVHRDLGQLLLEEVNVRLEGLVGDETVRHRRLRVSHTPSSVETRGDLPWLSAGQADGDDEDEGEEGERDHDGILENLSSVGTHLYCGQAARPPLYIRRMSVWSIRS